MPGNEVTVIQLCGKCNTQVGTFNIKNDNLMLTSNEKIWCPKCGEDTPEVRDIAGRLEAIKRETESYPKAVPAAPFPKPLPDDQKA